ncbi:MAG: DNA cytosine methyltransferase [Bacteroidota bacterium]
MQAIDLYSGIGGWTLGFKMAGIEIVSSYEWWRDANNTHNKNFGSTHAEVDIRKLKLEDLPDPETIDYVIGSPPCTQFSFANRGGNGDIADGLIDIHKFLEVVEYLKPKYWAMENVPRVAKILEREIQDGGALHRFKNLCTVIEVFDSSDFGVPQRRKRMIAGDFPVDLLHSYKTVTPHLTMGDVLHALSQNPVVDPIYGLQLNQEEVTDNIPETPLSPEEARINGDAKAYHTVYNKMSFPDQWDRPSRTITALCTRVSRESIIIQDHKGDLRRLSVRERGCLQSFPINYQYFSGSYGGKLKMIGNAVPPVLTFYIAQCMLERKASEIVHPNQVEDQLVQKVEMPIIHNTENRGAKYPWSRSFWLAIPGLRFGSGVRFEMRNYHDKRDQSTSWKVNFFFGNSKNIRSKELNSDSFDSAMNIWSLMSDNILNDRLARAVAYFNDIDIAGLQKNWTNRDRDRVGPIELIDQIGVYCTTIKETLSKSTKNKETCSVFVEEVLRNGGGTLDNKRLLENSIEVFVGILIGSCFNSIIDGKKVQLELEPMV